MIRACLDSTEVGSITDRDDSRPPSVCASLTMAYGTIVASFTVEDFSLRRLQRTDRAEIDRRFEAYRAMMSFGSNRAATRHARLPSGPLAGLPARRARRRLGPARGRRRPVHGTPPHRLPARDLPLVRAGRGDPVVVARPSAHPRTRGTPGLAQPPRHLAAGAVRSPGRYELREGGSELRRREAEGGAR